MSSRAVAIIDSGVPYNRWRKSASVSGGTEKYFRFRIASVVNRRLVNDSFSPTDISSIKIIDNSIDSLVKSLFVDD